MGQGAVVPLHVPPQFPNFRKNPYLPEEQTVPILRGEGEDLAVKIKVFLLTANTEMVENKMGHVHPGEA